MLNRHGMAKVNDFSKKIEEISADIVNASGNTQTLLIVLALVICWGLSGFFMHFSNNWAAIMETSSSVVTILMVFLIQKSQNKHSLSIQLKLNELIASNDKASNRLVNVEGMTEDELKVIQKYYNKLKEFTQTEDSLQQSHSIDESHHQHSIKKELEKELEVVKNNATGN